MEWFEVHGFSSDLEKLEKFFYDFAVLTRGRRALGLKNSLERANFAEVKEIVESFSSDLIACHDIAPLIDKKISERLSHVLTETKIENHMAQLSVRLRLSSGSNIMTSRVLMATLRSFTEIYFNVKYEPLFDEMDIGIEEILVSLARLKPLIKALADKYYERSENEGEIFKPSNVSVELVAEKIDLAIENIEMNVNIGVLQRENLVVFLKEAKVELAKSEPAWKKIVGTLVICSALLTGIADTPEALKNINDAINHVLGTSIEKTTPHFKLSPVGHKNEREPSDPVETNIKLVKA